MRELLGLPERVRLLEEAMGGLVESIQRLQSSVDSLNVLLKAPVRPDEWRDVT